MKEDKKEKFDKIDKNANHKSKMKFILLISSF